MADRTLSGAEAGRLAVERLQALIDAARVGGPALPERGGALHLAKICRFLGVGRATIHQNPGFKALLAGYAAERGLAFSGRTPPGPAPDQETTTRPDRRDRRIRELEKQVALLEKRNATLMAEIAHRRAETRRAAFRDEELLPAGRRIFPRPRG